MSLESWLIGRRHFGRTAVLLLLALLALLTLLAGAAPVRAEPAERNQMVQVGRFGAGAVPLVVTNGHGLARLTSSLIHDGRRLLCRLSGTVDVDRHASIARGTISMAVDHRTCVQVMLTVTETQIAVEYLTLVESRRWTVPREKGTTTVALDILNFAQHGTRSASDMVTVEVDPKLAGVSLKVGENTSLVETTSGERELELAAVTRGPFQAPGEIGIEARRAGYWTGRTGTVHVSIEEAASHKQLLARSLEFSSDTTATRGLRVGSLPNGTYTVTLRSDSFNSPSHISLLRKLPPPPWMLISLIGMSLILVGARAAMIRAGGLSRISFFVLAVATLVLAALYAIRLVVGDYSVASVPATEILASDGSSFMGQAAPRDVFPSGSVENALDTVKADWLSEPRDRYAYLYSLSGRLVDGQGRTSTDAVAALQVHQLCLLSQSCT